MRRGKTVAKAAAAVAATPPLPVPSWIATKRDGGELDDGAIRALVAGAADGSIPEYQTAALLMAIVFRGMSARELVTWTEAMIASGDRLVLDGVRGAKVDKHSTGGVGDKVSICLAPLVAACGVGAPMLVGRALGHSGGTIDKLEAIAGFRTQLEPAEFRKVLGRVGFVIAGQTPRIVPADRALYALRDATATVESIPLIASSILSKKIAGGADGLVMDVKFGRGAFMQKLADARALAETIVSLGNRSGLRTMALLTSMEEPLGREVGNASEVREAMEILRGEGPADTRALTVRLAAEMLVLGGAARTTAEGERRIEAAIASGEGLARLRKGIELQGGDPRVVDDPGRLPKARHRLVLVAPRAGYLAPVDARAIGLAATRLGAGRLRKEDAVDPAVGITLHRKGGARVERGEPVATVWYNHVARLASAQPLLDGAFRVEARRPGRAEPLVREVIKAPPRAPQRSSRSA